MNDITKAHEARRLYQLLSPYFLSYAGSLDLVRGTAFPTTGHDGAAVQAGARFFRTDLGFACYYDGTRWLTAEEFQCDLPPYSRNALPFAGAGATTVLLAPQRTDYATYYERAKAYLDVLTTNDGANYWAFSLLLGASTVWTANTSGDAAGAINKEHSTPGAAITAQLAQVKVTKTGAPSNVFIAVSYWYRLIIT